MNPSKGAALLAAGLTITCVPGKDLPSAAATVAPATALASPYATPNGAIAGGATERTTGSAAGAVSAVSAVGRDTNDATPVILVVLDGVRWQEVFNGIDPALAASHHVGPVSDARGLFPALYSALDARGAALGAPAHGTIAASGPNFVSLPGYTEIFGGRPPEGCADNACAGASGPTLVDAFRDRAAKDADVAVIASWAPIGRAATRVPSRIVMSAGREDVVGTQVFAEDPAMRDVLAAGASADPLPGHGAFRPDRFTSELALRYLEARRPDFLFVGLGESDEYAHADDYRGYLGALRGADAFFGKLFATLDRMGSRGRRSLVLVTADHGRGDDYRDHGKGLPESARVWLLAMGGPVHARGFVHTLVPRHLADVAPTIREMVGLPADESPHAGTPMLELFGDSLSAGTATADIEGYGEGARDRSK